MVQKILFLVIITSFLAASVGCSDKSSTGYNDPDGSPDASGDADSDGDTDSDSDSDAEIDIEIDVDCDPSKEDCSHLGVIDGVFFAQTHVQRPDDAYFTLVSNRETLIKVHVIAPGAPKSPLVWAVLSLDGKTDVLNLSGPDVLPAEVAKEPGKAQHSYDDSFTGFIPKEWMKPGLTVVVQAAADEKEIANLKIGAPTRVIMTMFDVQYFADTDGDYPEGWKEELESLWPVSELEVRRLPHVIFPELVIPTREAGGEQLPVVRISSKDDYKVQTGQNFDGEQAAALQWKSALKAAAGTSGRVSLYYVNIYGAWAGGQAGGFGGVGNGTHAGVLNHELGHALSLPHWGNSADYPYSGEMHGIPAPPVDKDIHAGPTWGFDLIGRKFRSPTTMSTFKVEGGEETYEKLTYRKDPMWGGGAADPGDDYAMRAFSDYSVFKMQQYLEGHVVVWNPDLQSYAQWDVATMGYTKPVTNNGVQFPVVRDVEVISVMASICASKKDVNMVYPPIGPYKTGLIDLFDPREPADREQAKSVFCNSGCDVSLRITQGGKQKIYMLAAIWDTSIPPTDNNALKTRAINLPASEGEITKAELLLTPDAELNGLPQNPEVLYSWTQ